MSQAHFDIETIIDRSFKQKGTVTIDRETGMVTIRALNNRRVYEMPLEQVVTLVVQKISRQQAAENQPARRRKLVSRSLLRGF